MSNILLVEDDASIATIYSIKMRSVGHDFVWAENGLVALKKLEDFTPEIILLDIRMPVMDGETFLSIIRKNEQYKEIPVIILSNLNKSEAPSTIWHLGITDFVLKVRHTPAEVMQIINKHLITG